MRKNKITVRILFCAALQFFYSCGNNKAAPNDNATSGSISIGVDETLAPLIDAEIEVFHSFYKDAKVTAKSFPETELIQHLIKDSSRLVISLRKLDDEEKKYFEGLKISVKEIPIALDGVAFIVNEKNPLERLHIGQVDSLFKGNIKTFRELDKRFPDEKIVIVADNPKSSILRQIKDSLLKTGNFTENLYALKSNQEVIDYVQNNPNSIGLIGLSYIGDQDDSTQNTFMKGIKVLDIQNPQDWQYYGPFQAYLALGKYPFPRKIYVLLREARTGLGTGFTSWLTSDKGQLIVQKAGLLPITMPLRIVNVRGE